MRPASKHEAAAVVLILAGLASAFGTPHLLVVTQCIAFGNRCTRDLAQCTYVGIQGWRKVVPMNDGEGYQTCGWISLQPLHWPLFQWDR